MQYLAIILLAATCKLFALTQEIADTAETQAIKTTTGGDTSFVVFRDSTDSILKTTQIIYDKNTKSTTFPRHIYSPDDGQLFDISKYGTDQSLWLSLGGFPSADSSAFIGLRGMNNSTRPGSMTLSAGYTGFIWMQSLSGMVMAPHNYDLDTSLLFQRKEDSELGDQVWEISTTAAAMDYRGDGNAKMQINGDTISLESENAGSYVQLKLDSLENSGSTYNCFLTYDTTTGIVKRRNIDSIAIDVVSDSSRVANYSWHAYLQSAVSTTDSILCTRANGSFYWITPANLRTTMGALSTSDTSVFYRKTGGTISGQVTINNGSSGGSPHSTSRLTIEDNVSQAINFLSPSTTSQYIMFGDESSENSGQIAYNHVANYMRFTVNGVTTATIDSNQNLSLVGNISADTGKFDYVTFNHGVIQNHYAFANSDSTFSTGKIVDSVGHTWLMDTIRLGLSKIYTSSYNTDFNILLSYPGQFRIFTDGGTWNALIAGDRGIYTDGILEASSAEIDGDIDATGHVSADTGFFNVIEVQKAIIDSAVVEVSVSDTGDVEIGGNLSADTASFNSIYMQEVSSPCSLINESDSLLVTGTAYRQKGVGSRFFITIPRLISPDIGTNQGLRIMFNSGFLGSATDSIRSSTCHVYRGGSQVAGYLSNWYDGDPYFLGADGLFIVLGASGISYFAGSGNEGIIETELICRVH